MDMDLLSSRLANGTSRRNALKRLGLGAVGLAGLNLLAKRTEAATSAAAVGSLSSTDIAVLQFALNLEYLEAQYYSYGVTGTGIEASLLTGSGEAGGVRIKANPKVTFTNPDIRDYAAEIAADERLHVFYLRNVLNFFGVQPVAQPAINLLESFNQLARAAGIGRTFDPFANEANFILGAFIFEDVGVTAYRGAAALIENPDVLSGAAGLLGTEAYHASLARVTISAILGDPAIAIAQKISDLRDTVDGNSTGPVSVGQLPDDDQGLTDSRGNSNIVPTNGNGLVFGRSTRQVLNILYFVPDAHSGGFFMRGLNGPIN